MQINHHSTTPTANQSEYANSTKKNRGEFAYASGVKPAEGKGAVEGALGEVPRAERGGAGSQAAGSEAREGRLVLT